MNQALNNLIIILTLFLFLFQSCDKTEPAVTVTYSSDIQNIMYNYCTSCHQGTAPSANLDLSTYQNVRNATLQGTLVQRVNDANNPMPASGLIAASDRKKIDDWVQAGCPQ
ncbi:hypothetical protein [Aureispira anguillae]|uniref:Cytochrome c domain-containing protein n=1 Tax=Aureispira anguillae TaxID=2864201 RepID=A0A916DVM9_9BACT|nr:hypothetical protein [Aureispira anguillae]BDS15309.1 hypothetical protein AsAng_0060930 [Aureispira anguillae]